jgi:hypothetical protein
VEQTKTTDIKIVLYAIAVFLGYWSHLVVKFPKEWYSIVFAVSLYAVIMAAHYYIEKYVEKEAFYISSDNKLSKVSLEISNKLVDQGDQVQVRPSRELVHFDRNFRRQEVSNQTRRHAIIRHIRLHAQITSKRVVDRPDRKRSQKQVNF